MLYRAIRILQTVCLAFPVYWALEPDCEIPIDVVFGLSREHPGFSSTGEPLEFGEE